MTKLCSVCHSQNKDEAQFCRSCGASFAASAPAGVGPLATAGDGTADNVCGECGFQNKPGIRYCANCGMSLTTAASGFGDLAAKVVTTAEASASADPYAGLSPRPISYTSFPPVAPYPPAPATPAPEAPLFDDLVAPDVPDADAAIAARQQVVFGTYAAPVESGFSSADDDFVSPAPNRARLLVIAVVSALLVAGAAAWWFMGSASSPPPESAAAPAPAPAIAPAPAPAPQAIASAPEPTPVVVEAAPASAAAPAVEAAVPATPTPVSPPATNTAAGALGTPPAAAAPLPQLSEAVPVESAASDAKRLAAEKARREKAARDKADREAKAKALSDQREQAAATSRAEQEAQARRRADEGQRARATAVPAALPAPAAQAKGVREICAGRGTIAEAVCQSRQCAASEHANEAICRQIREADERRRNYQN